MLLVFLLLGTFTKAYSCSLLESPSTATMMAGAKVIVRAKALEYAARPDPNMRTTGVPAAKIRFQVIETIRGPVPSDLVLPGYLSDTDDFNDQPSPYNFVRPGGRQGSCFANTYRSGAQFLLFLVKTKTGEFTVDWYPLGPVNEQLHAGDDPWLRWVREEAHRTKGVSDAASKGSAKK